MSVLWYVRHSTVTEMARTDDQFNLRLPDGMRAQLAQRAKSNMRSMNSEVIMILAIALGDESKPATGRSCQASPAAGPNDTACQGGHITHG